MNYTIKKGRHFADFTFNRLQPFVFGSKTEGVIRFSKECWHTRDSIQYTGWNKLTGMSGLLIHRNSARLVWMPNFNKPGTILIATYVYDRGIRKIHRIASVQVEEDIRFSISCDDDFWLFYIKDRLSTVLAHVPAIRLKAYPYFGGKSVAPHSMHISITRL